MSDLLDQVKRLQAEIEQRALDRGKSHAASGIGRTQREVTSIQRFFAQLVVAAIWSYRHLLSPLLRIASYPVTWLWRLFRFLWDRFVYVDDQFGNEHFSKSRAGIFLSGSGVFVWFILLPILGFLFDAAVYFSSARHDEVVYLTNSQEILPEENIHSVQGCYALPCSEENSAYFRIRWTLFNQAWSLTQGHGMFLPDYVAASVPLSISTCKVTSYGIRLKFLVRGLDLYPDLLRSECTPMVGSDDTPPAP
jgi:hypothetical protein